MEEIVDSCLVGIYTRIVTGVIRVRIGPGKGSSTYIGVGREVALQPKENGVSIHVLVGRASEHIVCNAGAKSRS